MGKIGGYEYPDWKLTEMKRIAEIIEDKLEKEIDRQRLATLLEHKSQESGTFVSKLIALERWGLSDGAKLTDLADRLLHPIKGEEWQVVLECIRKVDLFWKLLQRNPEKVSIDGFWEELVAITGCDRAKAEKEAEKIFSIYKDAYDYLARVKPEGVSIKEIVAGIVPGKKAPSISSIEAGTKAPVITIRPDMLSLTFPLVTVDDYEYAIATLEFLKRKKEEIEAKSAAQE